MVIILAKQQAPYAHFQEIWEAPIYNQSNLHFDCGDFLKWSRTTVVDEELC
jgi:hypothetical protein